MSLTDPSARPGSGSTTSHGHNEYTVPKPGRLNLRETRAERNERIRKSAEKEFRDHEAAIRKANKTHSHHNSRKRGRGSRSEYTDEELRILESLGTGDDFFISRGAGHLLHDDGDDEGDYSGPNVFRGGDEGVGVEASLAGRHTSNQGRMPDVRIPSRYAHTHAHTHGQASTSASASTSRSTFTFTHTTFGTNQRSNSSSFQEYSQQSEREYRDGIYRQMEWVRSHRAKRQSQAEAQERKAAQEAEYMRQILEAEKEERRREKRENKRRKRDRERAFEEGEEGRKRRRGSTPIYDQFDSRGNMAQAGPGSKTGAKESDLRRRKERERYLSRWKSLLSTDIDDGGDGDGDGIIETELSYKDIPWPIHQKSNLDTISIKTFLSSFASNSTTSSQKEQERKIYREAIRNFHPDRFNSKVLPRVREGERDKVKEGMEVCSRVLTGLISDNSASR